MRSIFLPALALCLAVVSMSGAVEKEPLVPEGAPLRKVKATVDTAGNLIVDDITYVTVSVTRVVRMGNEVKEIVEEKKVPVQRKRILIKSAFQVFDVEGKPVIGMALQQLLKTKRILLVRTDAKKPTAEQLKKLGGDTLLVFERLKKPLNKPIE